MSQALDQMCHKCGKRKAQRYSDLCRQCSYQELYAYMQSLPADEQDWEFAVCEECGSSLNVDGECTNTWCLNSPYLGTDWL